VGQGTVRGIIEHMEAEVLQAIQDAFNPVDTEPHLTVADDRVFGSVRVLGSAIFDELDDLGRQKLLWRKLREILGARSTRIGPVVLEPTRRG